MKRVIVIILVLFISVITSNIHAGSLKDFEKSGKKSKEKKKDNCCGNKFCSDTPSLDCIEEPVSKCLFPTNDKGRASCCLFALLTTTNAYQRDPGEAALLLDVFGFYRPMTNDTVYSIGGGGFGGQINFSKIIAFSSEIYFYSQNKESLRFIDFFIIKPIIYTKQINFGAGLGYTYEGGEFESHFVSSIIEGDYYYLPFHAGIETKALVDVNDVTVDAAIVTVVPKVGFVFKNGVEINVGYNHKQKVGEFINGVQFGVSLHL